RGDVSALRIRVFTLAGMAVQLRRNTQRLGESSKPMRCQQHLGGRFKFSLNTSNGAVFFFGVSGLG
ncbi:hypothetical protein, partial [Aeromonas sp. QDB21]|uniref:hypothetical protein n=1 Tax=Aeromonas sp. QDB21 TaxID=2990487 RepID=UPI0022E33A85